MENARAVVYCINGFVRNETLRASRKNERVKGQQLKNKNLPHRRRGCFRRIHVSSQVRAAVDGIGLVWDLG